MDVGLGVHYARFLAEGGLRFHYRRAREKLDSMMEKLC